MKKILIVYRSSFAVLILAGSFVARAQPGADVDAEQLQQALAKRDEIIINLLNRVEALEQRLAAEDQGAGRLRGGSANATGPRGSVASTNASNSTNTTGDIDELAAERALERGLVQQGLRLLRSGQGQIAPATSYARLERSSLALLNLQGSDVPGETQSETEIFDFTLQGRLGLPFNSQLEISLPYRDISTTRKNLSGGTVQSVSENSGAGRGNARIGIATRLLQESSWRPDLLGRFIWLTGSGVDEDGGVGLGGNYSGVGVDLNATWRRDPVVFLLGGGYFRFDNDGLQPGNTFNLSMGVSLAISPESALTISLDQSFADDFKLDGTNLPGTDHVSSLLNITTSTLLGRGALLQVSAGVGLTPDAPDYLLGVSLPFNAGFLW